MANGLGSFLSNFAAAARASEAARLAALSPDEIARENDERLARIDAYRASEEAESARKAEVGAIKRKRAAERRATYGLPFEWHPNNKISYGGLSARGSGNGMTAASVFHVVCDQPVEIGRIRRAKGDLLCGVNDGSFGLGNRGEGDFWAVSCKACLRIADRFRADA